MQIYEYWQFSNIWNNIEFLKEVSSADFINMTERDVLGANTKNIISSNIRRSKFQKYLQYVYVAGSDNSSNET